jgi:hypothetical protein
VVENQLLGNCTAMRVAEHGSRVDAKMVEQARQLRREVRSCIRRGKSPTPPVATQKDYPVAEIRRYWEPGPVVLVTSAWKKTLTP